MQAPAFPLEDFQEFDISVGNAGKMKACSLIWHRDRQAINCVLKNLAIIDEKWRAKLISKLRQ